MVMKWERMRPQSTQLSLHSDICHNTWKDEKATMSVFGCEVLFHWELGLPGYFCGCINEGEQSDIHRGVDSRDNGGGTFGK